MVGSLDTSQFDREFTSMPIFSPDQRENKASLTCRDLPGSIENNNPFPNFFFFFFSCRPLFFSCRSYLFCVCLLFSVEVFPVVFFVYAPGTNHSVFGFFIYFVAVMSA